MKEPNEELEDAFENINSENLSKQIKEVVDVVNETVAFANNVDASSPDSLQSLMNDAEQKLLLVKSVYKRKGLLNGLSKENSDAIVDCETLLESIIDTAANYLSPYATSVS